MSAKNIIITRFNALSNKPNTFTLTLPTPFDARGYEVAVGSLYIFHSWPNISATKFGNNKLTYIWNGVPQNVTIPDGYYDIDTLNQYLQQFVMKQNKHYLIDASGNEVYYISLVLNPTYYAVTVTCTPVPSSLPAGWTAPSGFGAYWGQTPQIIFRSSLNEIVGYPADAVYPVVPQNTIYQVNSPKAPQVTPVTTVSLSTNLTLNAEFSTFTQCILTFAANVPYGALQVMSPNVPAFYPVIDQTFREITIMFHDEQYRELELKDPNIVCNLILRKRTY